MNGITWNLRFVKRLTEAGLTISEANDILIAGNGTWDYEEENPEDMADAELSYMVNA